MYYLDVLVYPPVALLMKTLPCFILALLLALTGNAQTAPGWEWAVSAGGKDYDGGTGVATDQAGNIYVTGTIKDTSVFGPFVLPSSGSSVYLAKYSAAGGINWVKNIGRSHIYSGIYASGICLDSLGNIILAGSFWGKGIFGQDTLSSAGSYSAFLAKFDSSGNQQWVRNAATGQAVMMEFGIAADKAGNIFLGSRCGSGVVVGSQTLPVATSFIAQFSPGGNLNWARAIKGNGAMVPVDLAADPWGNVYVTGSYRDSATFGTETITSFNHTSDIFLVKYNSAGGMEWVRQAGGKGTQEMGIGIAADSYGNVFVTGVSGDSASFGSFFIRAIGEDDIFTARYDSSGAVQWVASAPGKSSSWSYEMPLSVAADEKGNAIITGNFLDSVYFGGLMLSNNHPNPGRGAFVVKYDGSGNAVWAVKSGNHVRSLSYAGHQSSFGICIDHRNSAVIITGSYNGPAVFGATSILNGGADDMFLARLSMTTGVAPSGSGPDDLVVYPNPAARQIHIQYPAGFREVTMLDGTGRIVAGRTLSPTGKDVLVPGDLPEGMYWLRFSGNDHTEVRSVILRH